MKKETAAKIMTYTKEIYDSIAKDFSNSRNNLWPEFEYFKGYLAKGQEILDLGCGNGRLMELLRDYQPRYLGLDISPKLIAEAKQSWPNYDFQVHDILDLSSLQKKFDIVFCVATLHHIPSKKLREQVLQNIRSVLKPEGKLLMTNWNLWQKRYLKYIIKYTLLKLSESKKEINGIEVGDLDLKDVFIPWQKKHQRYLHAFTEFNLSSLLKKQGFSIIKNVSNKRNFISIAKNSTKK